MSHHAPPRCAFCPSPVSGRSQVLGILAIMVAASPGSPDLLALLGETDTTLQDWMRKGYPYVFTMGGGQYCTDFHQAADILLQRSYPEVFNNTQTATVFIPETFLPTDPLALGTKKRWRPP